MAQLTAGAVNSMNNNQAAGIKPTLQLIDVKKIQPANPHAMAADRYPGGPPEILTMMYTDHLRE